MAASACSRSPSSSSTRAIWSGASGTRASIRSSMPCRCRAGLLYTSKLGALLLIGLLLQLVVIAVRHRRPDLQGLPHLRARAVRLRPAGPAHGRILPDRGAGPVFPGAAAEQAPRSVRHGALLRGGHRAAHRGVRAPPVSVWRQPRLRLLGHERLRPHARAWGWFNLYWTLAALLLAGLTALLWVRGQTPGLRQRLRLARAASARGRRIAVLRRGARLRRHRRLHLLQHQRPQRVPDLVRSQAAAGRLRAAVQAATRSSRSRGSPTCASTSTFAPRPAGCACSGRYQLENKTAAPIGTVHVNLVHPGVKIHRLGLGALAGPTTRDERLQFYTFALPAPLPPGGTAPPGLRPRIRAHRLQEQRRHRRGGRQRHLRQQQLPAPAGLPRGRRAERRRRPAQARSCRPGRAWPTCTTSGRASATTSRRDADWIDFAATACTSPDQVAFVPGYLERDLQRGRPPLLRLRQPGQDPALLLGAVGPLRHPARSLRRRCRSRSTTTPGTSTTSIG